MKISTLLEDKELSNLQQKFYEYFNNGYHFEEFIREYLQKMGLDEIEITQRARDGGIDLTAIRKGIGDFSEIDTINYFIQVKRYALNNKIDVKTIRELKGTIPFGHKRMLICTSSFTEPAEREAINDPSKPVVLINGKSLVQSCIDHGIGFIFKPIFSSEQLDKFIKSKSDEEIEGKINIVELSDNYIEKIITQNDIRAKIISIPSSIFTTVSNLGDKINVLVNNDKTYTLTINRTRRFLSGVTEILREYNLLSTDNVITPRNAKWCFDKKDNLIKLIIEN